MATRKHRQKKLSNTTMLFIVIAIALAIIIISGGMPETAQFAKAGTTKLTAPITKPNLNERITVEISPNTAFRNGNITIRVNINEWAFPTCDLDSRYTVVLFDGNRIRNLSERGITEFSYTIPPSTSLGVHTVRAECSWWVRPTAIEGSSVPVTVVNACGDSIIDSGEKCEKNNLAGATCQSLGFLKGTLACRSDCQYDTSKCSIACGNNICESSENYLTCPADCATPYCNDGICQSRENAISCPADCAAGWCAGTHVGCSVYAGEPSVCQKHGCIIGGMGGQLCTGTPHSCSSIPTKGFCDAEAEAGCSWQ